MKKLIALVCALALVCCAFAAAETTVEQTTLNFYSVELNAATDTLAGNTERGGRYGIYGLDGTQLSNDLYDYYKTSDYGFEVENYDTINGVGFLSGDGQVLVPAQYGDVEIMSSRWQVGIYLVSATSDNYDYKTLGTEQTFYLIDHADVYYCGKLIGTLPRASYQTGYSYSFGDYLATKDRDGNIHRYNKEFVESPYHDGTASREYDDVYQGSGKYVYYHTGTGMAAFTEGCTLTADEVHTSVQVIDGVLTALDGTAIAEVPYDSIGSFTAGYARVKDYDTNFCGVIDMQGNLVVPVIYDDIDIDGAASGYVKAEMNGMSGYVSLTDGSEAGFTFSENSATVRPTFAFIKNTDGSITIASAAAGELAGVYADYQCSYSYAGPIIAVEDADGKIGVIGMAGETVIPFSEDCRYCYDYSINNDGSLVLNTRTNVLYRISYELDTDAVAAALATGKPWNCPVCGRQNDAEFNFCPMDATAKPAV